MSIEIGGINNDVIDVGAVDVSTRRRIFIVVVPLARTLLTIAAILAVIGAALAGYWLGGGADALQRLMEGDRSVATVQTTVDLPEMIVNLRGSSASKYLKIGITLGMTAGNKAKVEQSLPRLIDAEHEFMRNVDQYDLEGSAGLARLRLELRRRIDLILGPDIVTDVLLRSLLTQ